jgi:hypothetical protein
MSNDSKNDHDMPTCLVLQCDIGDFKVKNCWSNGSSLEDGKKSKKTTPVKVKKQGLFIKMDYFLQAQPQPDDFLSSFFCMVPDSEHSGHFFGLHLPSLVAPHFSHLNTAILFLL